MNTASAHTSGETGLPASAPAHFPTAAPPAALNQTPLAELTRKARFAKVAPHLQQALGYFATPGAHILDTLTNNINQLQESFVESLSERLLAGGIDITHKITLRLDENALLRLACPHPDKESIDALLAADPDLSVAFQEIAAQSAALRNIYSLHSMLMQINTEEGPHQGMLMPFSTTFQLSLKGDMSHFYFNSLS